MRGSQVDGRYDVIEMLGEGGFGWVFEVKHKLLGQRFAMKILHPNIARDRDWISRFREEAKATSLIGHESIVFVTDFGACPEYGYYFVMEYLDGQTLGDYLSDQKDRQADLRLVRQFAMTAAAALGAVHELDIVHCDLKPGNIMLVKRRGRLEFKFLDFGTSTIVAHAGKTDMVFGTPAYMAPEQATGHKVDTRADVFSLSCILYEMIGGKEPWYTENWNDAFPEMRNRHPPDGLEMLRKEVSDEVDEVIRRGLAMARSDRWPDVESMVQALVNVLDVEEGDEFEPMDDPFDSIRINDQFARSLTAPRVEVPQEASSMVIELDGFDPDDSEAWDSSIRTEISVVYRTANRLRREWRRNVIGGGLFLPSEARPAIGAAVRLILTYAPGQRSVEINAEVVSHRDDAAGSPLGFGVSFEGDGSKTFRKFIRDLQLGLDLSHEDFLRRIRDFDSDAPLTAGEAFILSRLDDPLPFGRIRAMCSGLPFEVEQCIDGLLDRGWIVAESGTPGESELSEVTEIFEQEGDTAFVQLSVDEVESVRETVAFFIEQRNYMAAVHVLKNAIRLAPSHVDFHVRYAELTYRFLGDSSEARRAIERARELAPDDDDVRKVAEMIE